MKPTTTTPESTTSNSESPGEICQEVARGGPPPPRKANIKPKPEAIQQKQHSSTDHEPQSTNNNHTDKSNSGQIKLNHKILKSTFEKHTVFYRNRKWKLYRIVANTNHLRNI